MEDSTFCSRISKVTDTLEVGCALLTSHGEEVEPRRDKFRKRVGTVFERTLAGESRMETYEGRIAETERVRERRRDRSERGAGDVPQKPGNKHDEQVAVRHADASGVYIIENQHEEKIMRDIQVSKRGSEAASEEQSDKWRKTERFEQEAPTASASSDPYVALEYLRVGRHNVDPGPHLCRSQVMLMTTYKFLRWMHSTRRMDEEVVTSEKCWSGIEEKISQISKELNWVELDMSQCSQEENLET